jgi:hypothetical protein
VTRQRAVLLSLLTLLAGLFLGWLLWRARPAVPSPVASTEASQDGSTVSTPQDKNPTLVYAHNLMLRKGPDFRVYVSWIRGEMRRTHPQVNPSFDDPDSFILEIQQGVIRANIGDLGIFLNASAPKDAPLKNISIQPEGDQLVLHGTVHKILPLPVELKGSLSATADGRVQFHVNKLDVLKIPMKGLLGSFHISLSDLAHSGDIPGIQISGNDIFFDTEKLLSPPHIHGKLTAVEVKVPDVEVVYGGVRVDDAKLAQWHNFLRLRGGTVAFGKLTMDHTDLTMIDASPDAWFDLDLVNYQAQLVNGYSRMTPQAGLEIFMPDVDEQAPKKKANQEITLEWLKDRNESLPADIPVRH